MAQPVEFDSRGDGSVGAFPDPTQEPAHKVRVPLLSEILTKVHKAKYEKDKVKILQQEDCPALRQILKWNFDPNIATDLPEGIPPYVENEAPEGTEHMLLRTEGDKLWHYIKTCSIRDGKEYWKSADPNLQSTMRERMFIRLLEGLHKDEAKLLLKVKDKKLAHNKNNTDGYKGLSAPVCKKAFGWDDNFRKKDV